MHALVVSHAAVIPANQALYCEMERLDDVQLTLVAPRRWRASVGGPTAFERHPDLQCEVLERDVWLNGHINLHFYRGLRAADLADLPDIVYADEDPYSLAAYQSLRLARTLRVPFVFKSNQNIAKRYPPPFSWTERIVMARAHGAIAIAPECERVLRAKGCACPIDVIGHSIDPEVFTRRDTSETRRGLGLQGFVIGFLGRLSEEKGVADLVAASVRLAGEGVSAFSLLLIGDGPLRPALERTTQFELGAVPVHLTGSIPHGQAADYLNCMDVLVLPSRTHPNWKEQFGRVIIEAMACGVPVVGSDSGNIPVLIEETAGGLVCPEGDVDALADMLASLVGARERARALGQAGREYVLGHYTHARIAGRIAAALRRAFEASQ